MDIGDRIIPIHQICRFNGKASEESENKLSQPIKVLRVNDIKSFDEVFESLKDQVVDKDIN